MRMTRRQFSVATAGVLAGAAPAGETRAAGRMRRVQTVLGPVDPTRLGRVLMHEHVLVDFVGADAIGPGRYDRDEAARVILPHLKRLRELGCDTLVECTPRYLGRDIPLLQRLSRESGLHLITNTGLYAAGNLKYLPRKIREDWTAEDYRKAFVEEHRNGLDGTSVRPGAIKTGIDGAPLSRTAKELVRGATLAQRETGLPILQHTGSGRALLESLEAADRREGDGALVWVHAQSEVDRALHVEAARRGVWVEFDGIAPQSVKQHVELVMAMRAAGRLNRVLVSHDAGWYHVGEPGGGTFRGFETLFREFLPALRAAGASEADVRTLLVDNPRAALTPTR